MYSARSVRERCPGRCQNRIWEDAGLSDPSMIPCSCCHRVLVLVLHTLIIALNLPADRVLLTQVMEALYRARWTEYDGLGALMISPTRELALQIFDELRKVGKYHSFSAGLLIGGKSVDDEAKHINSELLSTCLWELSGNADSLLTVQLNCRHEHPGGCTRPVASPYGQHAWI